MSTEKRDTPRAVGIFYTFSLGGHQSGLGSSEEDFLCQQAVLG